MIRVLGEQGKYDTTCFYCLRIGLPYKFPAEVLTEADNIPISVSIDDLKERLDYRK
jgi:exoribonuclease R